MIAYLPLTGFNVAKSFHTLRLNKTARFDFTSKESREVLSHFPDTKIKVVYTESTDSNESP